MPLDVRPTLWKMSTGIPCDGESVFKLSVVLLCILSLLWLVVLFLFIWVRKIQKQAEKTYKDLSIYFKAAVDVTPPGRENSPEIKADSVFSFPLVISNKRAVAVNSDAEKSWKSINRTFAYSQGDQEGDDKKPVLEDSPGTQEYSADVFTLKEPENLENLNDFSGIKAVDDSPSVLFLSGENPGERKCQQKVFRSMRDYLDLCEKSSPVKESSLVLIDVDNSFPAMGEEDWPEDETSHEQQSLSMETDATESKEKSTSEKNLESTANLDQPERAKNGANEIIGDEHLSEKITSGISESAKSANGHLEEDNSMVPRQQDEAQILLPNATQQVKKRKPRTKKRPKEKRKSKGYPALPDNNHIEPMQVRKEQEHPDCRIQPGPAEHSELELFRKGTDQDFDEDGDKNVLAENENGKKGKDVSVNHCQAGTKEEAKVEESYEVVRDPSISSQWQPSSPKSTNHPMHDANANLTEQNDQDINDEIYSNIDNNNEGYNDVELFYVNHQNLKRHVNQGISPDDSHVYADMDELQRESGLFFNNAAFVSADDEPFYVNTAEMKGV